MTIHQFAKFRPAFVWSLGISLYFVIFLWGVWEKGVSALGFSATIFGFLVLVFFGNAAFLFRRGHFFWIIPYGLIVLSFSIYENPWLKTISILLLPVIFVFFYNYSVLSGRSAHIWNVPFFHTMVSRIFSFISRIGDGVSTMFHFLLASDDRAKNIAKKIILGLFLFFIIGSVVIIPLLSSADAAFSQNIENFYAFLRDTISWTFVMKVIVVGILSILQLSMFIAWTEKFTFQTEKKPLQLDAIISGIVLLGVLMLYLLFLWTQVQNLFVPDLPQEFQETESLVKSGFWQLFVLSLINIVFFFFYYRNTHRFVQHILVVFTMASLLLLCSAAQRMFLYVTLYGLSYEKFFASYTVLYILMLFVALIFFLFRLKKTDILKFLLISFVWMYSVATILPIEQIIFRANVALSEREESRIDLFELRMLSLDVIGLVENYRSDVEWRLKWQKWLDRQQLRLETKAWYEKNIMNLVGTESADFQ